MSAVFWWVVVSAVVSMGGVVYAWWLFQRANSEAEARTERIVSAIEAAASGDEPETFDREVFLKANKPLLDAVADVMFERFNLIDQNTTNALSPKANDARSMIALAMEVREDPSKAMEIMGFNRSM